MRESGLMEGLSSRVASGSRLPGGRVRKGVAAAGSPSAERRGRPRLAQHTTVTSLLRLRGLAVREHPPPSRFATTGSPRSDSAPAVLGCSSIGSEATTEHDSRLQGTWSGAACCRRSARAAARCLLLKSVGHSCRAPYRAVGLAWRWAPSRSSSPMPSPPAPQRAPSARCPRLNPRGHSPARVPASPKDAAGC